MDELNRRTLLGAVGITGMAAVARAAHAGPLNPPSGAVVGTGRTVDEIFNKIPGGGAGDGRIAIAGGSNVTISNPGSYVLTANVDGASGGNGITIGADNVTLDLNGFAVSSGFTSGVGIQVNPGISGVVIRNGIIKGFGTGVLISGSSINIVVEHLLVRGAKATGIAITNVLCRAIRVRHCTICDTGLNSTTSDVSLTVTGIVSSGSASAIEDCVVLRVINNSLGTPSTRGIVFAGGVGHSMARCSVLNDGAIAATGVLFASITGICTYRDNTVVNFSTKYSGTTATDAGGNF